jgi:hypothetical protein
MNFNDLHDPQAAAELIQKFRKRFKTKTCMSPQDNHSGPIISAHTLSVESMLRKIARDSHVYSIKASVGSDSNTHPIVVKLVGLREVSVFNGFCRQHDKELFSCLEDRPFQFTRQQTFMLAFRAASRECYLKRKLFESLPTPEEFSKIHGINEKLAYSEMALVMQAGNLKGAEEAEMLKSQLDKYFISSAWDRLETKVLLFPKTPTVIGTAAFQPFYDMNGNQLQEFDNLNIEMSQIMLSVIPIEAGTAAIFSWLDTSNNAPRRFFESVSRSKDITSAVIHALVDNMENVAFNPQWYEGLSESKKNYLHSRIMLFEATLNYSETATPHEKSPFLDDWGICTETSF